MYRRVDGVEQAARSRVGRATCSITAKPDQQLVPLPEGSSYLGFIFAEGATTATRSRQALRDAHAA